MGSFILFLKEKFRICELLYESSTEGLTIVRPYEQLSQNKKICS